MRIIAVALFGLLLAACGTGYWPPAYNQPAPPTQFSGVNYWAFTADPATPGSTGGCVSSGPRADRAAVLQAHGVKVVRIGGFQGFAETGSTPTRNWAALDAAFTEALSRGMTTIVPLANEWDRCDGPGTMYRKDCDWFSTGYTQQTFHGQTHAQSYRDYVAAFVTRYTTTRSDLLPAIKYLELMNEPHPIGDCKPAVKAWADDMSHLIHSIWTTAWVSMGGDGDGWDYADVNGIPTIDVLTYHDYSHATEPLPATKRGEIDTAVSLGKPIYGGENGIDCNHDTIGCGSPCDESAMASLMVDKGKAQLNYGATGYLTWAYNHLTTLGACDYDFGQTSPRLDVAHNVAP